MNLAVAAATFALVIPAELPDKTFISCVVLSSRNPALPVWIGAALALILQAAVAVVAGGLLALLPHTAVRAIVGALFLAGAAYLIFVPEKSAQEKGTLIGESAGIVTPNWKVLLKTFSIVALAEFGDITQVLIANLTARYRDAVSVFVGAAVAFLLISGVGVVAGKTITRYVPLSLVRRLSGVALLGLAVWSLVGLL